MPCVNCLEPKSLWWQPVTKTPAICHLLLKSGICLCWVYLFLSPEPGSGDEMIGVPLEWVCTCHCGSLDTLCGHWMSRYQLVIGPIITQDRLVSGMDIEHLRYQMAKKHSGETFTHRNILVSILKNRHQNMSEPFFSWPLMTSCWRRTSWLRWHLHCREPDKSSKLNAVSGVTVSQVLRPTLVQFEVTDLMETDLHRVIYSKQAMWSFGYRVTGKVWLWFAGELQIEHFLVLAAQSCSSGAADGQLGHHVSSRS